MGSPWSKKEVELLEEKYKPLGLAETAKLLNRSYAAVQSKAKKLGLQPGNCGTRKLPDHQAARKQLFRSYSKAAHNRHYTFDLTRKQFDDLTRRNCFYCGIEPTNKYRGYARDFGLKFNGVDRTDNSLGYTMENCVPCCSTCNMMKHQLTVSQFLSHIRNVYTFSLGE
jgi:hypothetical protein